jgi:flagellar hook-associated protein 1 FlgK
MEMARNAMQTARQGAEIAGHNLANAANPTYARQRVKISSSVSIPTAQGPQGSGSEVARLEQIRDYALDKALVSEKSVTQYLEAKQRLLQRAEAALGQTIDRQSIDAGGAYTNFGIAEGLSGLFNSFQSLSANPTSTAERQTVLFNAQKLADKFNSLDRRLDALRTSINTEVSDDIKMVNARLEQVAYLAASVGNTEVVEGAANELRDNMQAALEELSELVNVTTTTNEDGKLSIFVDGHQMVTDNALTNSLKKTTDVNGMHFLAESKGGAVVELKSGSLKGMIDARDNEVLDLRDDLNQLATNVISLINEGGDDNLGSTNGLIAQYPLTGNVQEVTGNATDGTVNGATLTADRAGRANKAYNFDGINDSISLGDNDIYENFTVSGWFNLSNGTTGQNAMYAAGTDNLKLTASDNGTITMNVGGTNSYVATSAGAFATNQWVHVVGSWDGTNARIHVNGTKLVDTTNSAGSSALTDPTAADGTLGADLVANDDFFKGQLGDLRIYNRALSDTEIGQLNQITPLIGHKDGKGLNGTTGELFFTGSGAGDINVNETLINDPRKLQAASATGEAGDNSVIRYMANFGQIAVAGLNGMNASEHYGNTISRFGQDMSLNTTQLNDQMAVQTMLLKQRESVSGVSIDEEVANLIIFQRAFQASARLITTMDALMNEVINMQS